MSLIQEALKRQAEETGGIINPSAPPDNPPAPASGEKSTRPLFIILTVVLTAGIIIVLAGFGFYLIKPGKPPANIQQIPEPVSVEPAVSAVPPDKPAVQTPAMPEVKPAVAESLIEQTEIEKPAPVEWPKLTLTGIARGDSQRLAIINGKMLSAGRTVGEVMIREVHDTEVVVECHGERRILYINE